MSYIFSLHFSDNYCQFSVRLKKAGATVLGIGDAAYDQLREEELIALFLAKPETDYIMEEFISGNIISFDWLTHRNDNIVFYTGHVFMDGIMETVNEDNNLYYYFFRTLPEDLKETGMSTVRAFDIRERFFHIEYFRRKKEKRIIALEINVRPLGGYTIDMFNYVRS